MIKQYKIFLLCIIVFASSQITAKHDLNWQAKKLAELYVELDFFIKKNLIKEYRHYNWYNNSYNFGIRFEHLLARQSYDEYIKKANALNSALLLQASGNGFVLGMLAAGINKKLGNKKINTKTVLGLIASAMGTEILQNLRIGAVPYYDTRTLQPGNNLLWLPEMFCARSLASLATATVSYFGTTYFLERLQDFRKARQNKTQAPLPKQDNHDQN